MKMKKLILIILTFTTFNCFSQSIATAINHDRKYDIKQEFIVKKITSKVTYYRKNKTERKRRVSSFNEKNMLKSELRYDEGGKLTARLNVKYDSTKTRSLGRKYETWNKSIGYRSGIAEYIYDINNFLVKTIEKNSKNQIFRITSLENNEKGNPIKLVLKENNFKGIETAVYDYDKNIVEISVLNNNGKVISKNKMRIKFYERKFKDLKYNENGDLIESNGKKYSYKYDKKNNWIRKTNYELKNGKWKKYQTIERKIKYRN
ncbi:hypothetical protein [Tenacibaculum haliotis]|uniref:hypothetical protein n=1 Tax=Tenacibaculum haliotis TaxID=1888914 RepID=UPI0021AE6BF2|nr:hypothetical protein [Tenacibaculum haliotis]MCT4697611.1 hypothetical protein [Tenacibaculum haliotis]